eukprot:gene15760-21341_t
MGHSSIASFIYKTTRTIEQIEADIEAVKSNANWATCEAALNAISAFTVEKNQLNQSTVVINDLSKVWKAIVDKNLLINGKEWRFIDENVNWVGGVHTLHNRQCYDNIIKKIVGKSRVLIIGTPGIGKSLFLQRFLEDGLVMRYKFLQDGTVIYADHNDPHYLLSDSVDLRIANGLILSLEVASDKETNYNHFYKRVNEAALNLGIRITMPLFEKDELQALYPTYTPEEVGIRFEVFGGSARNFSRSSIPTVPELAIVKDVTQWYFQRQDLQNSMSQSWLYIVRTISDELSKSDTDFMNIINSVLYHRNEKNEKNWASKYMEILAGEISIQTTSNLCGELKKIFGSTGMGNLFEAIGHRKLTTCSTAFTFIPLLPIGANNNNKIKTIKKSFNKQIVRFSSIEDISNMPRISYGLPILSNFPLIDAVLQPDTLIQFTISPHYHKGASNRLSEIRATLLEKNQANHKMVFVIPSENLKSFKFQTELLDIQQYVSTPESLINEKMATRADEIKPTS